MRGLSRALRPAGASLRAVALLVLLLAVFFIAARGFSAILLLDNIRQAAPLGVVVAGQALVLMMGRLDLSVGATASMANIVLCSIFNSDMANLVPAVAATLGAGVLVGPCQRHHGDQATHPRLPRDTGELADHRRAWSCSLPTVRRAARCPRRSGSSPRTGCSASSLIPR